MNKGRDAFGREFREAWERSTFSLTEHVKQEKDLSKQSQESAVNQEEFEKPKEEQVSEGLCLNAAKQSTRTS